MGHLNLLLDTCTFIWLVSSSERLPSKVARSINAATTSLFLSDISVWEITMKWQLGKLRLPQPPRYWIESQRERWSLSAVPIEREHLYRVSELPMHHRDPFDRLLIAQAIECGLTLVTPDEALHRYPAATLWD